MLTLRLSTLVDRGVSGGTSDLGVAFDFCKHPGKGGSTQEVGGRVEVQRQVSQVWRRCCHDSIQALCIQMAH